MTDVLPVLKKLERRAQDMVLTYDDASEYTVTYDDLAARLPLCQMLPHAQRRRHQPHPATSN
ncbi:MAG: hypothetical protein CM15mP78_13720 [Candidatus Poseidoniales archaeon]|nr:MAG: hypothetical protein CM15mP78_13720 [Candidatus Poseidoniales archaeon]